MESHASIPYRMVKQTQTPKPEAAKQVKEYKEVELEAEDVQALDQDTNMGQAVCSISCSMPATSTFRWSAQEMDLINLSNTRTQTGLQ